MSAVAVLATAAFDAAARQAVWACFFLAAGTRRADRDEGDNVPARFYF
jgi:hypothetical protein